MKRYFLILIFLSIFVGHFVHAEVPITTGFIPGQIWYSKEPLAEGDNVKVYTAIWNGDNDSLSAQVTFYDKNVVLGTRDVVVLPSQMKDIYVSWQVTSGDHSISAKIVSSSISPSGKKEQVTLSRSFTSEDHKFVPVLLKTSDGTPASNSDIVNSQIDNVSSTVNNIIPESVSSPISKSFNSIDDFRNNTSSQIDSLKNSTQKTIDSFSVKSNAETNDTKAKKISDIKAKEASPINQIDKPMAYIKLFFLYIFSFIFSNKIIFYGLIAVVIFLLLRYVYRKIKYR